MLKKEVAALWLCFLGLSLRGKCAWAFEGLISGERRNVQHLGQGSGPAKGGHQREQLDLSWPLQASGDNNHHTLRSLGKELAGSGQDGPSAPEAFPPTRSSSLHSHPAPPHTHPSDILGNLGRGLAGRGQCGSSPGWPRPSRRAIQSLPQGCSSCGL